MLITIFVLKKKPALLSNAFKIMINVRLMKKYTKNSSRIHTNSSYI